MRTELEKKLAILTLKNERKTVKPMSLFGDNNHKVIDMSIEVIEGKYDEDDLYLMEEEGQLTDNERMNIESFLFWLNGTGEELEDLLFDPNSLVTELPESESEETTCSSNTQICPKPCKECPFSNKSPQGWISDYSVEDFQKYMNAEVSFPCHMQMPNVDQMSPEQCKEAIDKGQAKLCRGYVEMLIKSCKAIRSNGQLIRAIKLVKEQGLNDDTMPIWEFFKHHDPEKA